jgi:hypothetical protein
MSTQPTIGYGSKLRRGNGDGPPETYSDVARVVSIEPPSQEADDVEVTDLDSPDGFKEYIAGMTEPGECSFEINFLPSHPSHNATTGLLADKASGAKKNWEIEFSDEGATKCHFAAYVKGFGPSTVSPNDPLRANVTLKLSGTVTWL